MRLNHRILASAALTFALTAPALAADAVTFTIAGTMRPISAA